MGQERTISQMAWESHCEQYYVYEMITKRSDMTSDSNNTGGPGAPYDTIEEVGAYAIPSQRIQTR